MKDSLSALELKYVIEELKTLIGGRLDRVYQPKREEFILQFYNKEGKKLIRIVIGKAIYIASTKDVPETPSGFCQNLRRHLEGMRLESITQPGFERIIKLEFKSKDKTLCLIFELFGKGNVALTEAPNDRIILLLDQIDVKDRILKANLPFAYPERMHDPFNMNKEEFREVIKMSGKENIVKVIASDLGLGGTYAEEICLRSGIDKSKKILSDNETNKILNAIKAIKNEKSKPNIVFKDDKILEILPFELESYKNNKKEHYKTFSEAIDSVLSKQLVVEKQKLKEGKYSGEMKRLQSIIDIQSKHLKSLKKEAEESKKIGERIYENYQQVEDALEKLNEARKKLSWKEIEEKIKGNKIIKKINPKENSVVVEI